MSVEAGSRCESCRQPQGGRGMRGERSGVCDERVRPKWRTVGTSVLQSVIVKRAPRTHATYISVQPAPPTRDSRHARPWPPRTPHTPTGPHTPPHAPTPHLSSYSSHTTLHSPQAGSGSTTPTPYSGVGNWPGSGSFLGPKIRTRSSELTTSFSKRHSASALSFARCSRSNFNARS